MTSAEQFRQQTHDWLKANCPKSQRQPVLKDEQLWAGRRQNFPSEDARLWFERMRDKGWTAPDWPEKYGGGGLSVEQCKVLSQEMMALGCRPPLYDLGLWMLGPALLEFGNEQQKAEHIPKIVRGEIRWCQGYSEPSAGSDLASLITKAEDKGDHFLVNGSKLWTSNADKSDWIFCLVRTDTSAPKQEGISFLLIDMASEGISSKPIQLISGDSEFCEVFFDDVKVAKENLVDKLNNGWSVAKALLKHERKLMSNLGSMGEREGFSVVEAAIKYVGLNAEGKLNDPELRSQLTRHLMNTRAEHLTGYRSYQQHKQGVRDPGLALIMKLVSTAEMQCKDELLLTLLGNRGLGWSGDEYTEDEKRVARNWASNKGYTIAGGTSEVQLNIIAKRALGLPD